MCSLTNVNSCLSIPSSFHCVHPLAFIHNEIYLFIPIYQVKFLNSSVFIHYQETSIWWQASWTREWALHGWASFIPKQEHCRYVDFLIKNSINCRLDFWGNADLASVNLFKINNWNTRAMCEICSKLILKTTTLGSFEQISHIVLMFVFPILKELVTVGNCQQPAFSLKNFPHRFYMCHHSIVTVYREAWYLER